LSPLLRWRRTTSSRRRRGVFLRVVGELGFHHIAVERALLVEQGRRGRAEAVRAMVAARAVSQPMIRSALFSVLSDNGTPSSLNVQQIADQRHATRFCVGSRAKRNQVDPEVVQHKVSVSLGIVGRVRFRSGWIVGTGTAWGVPNAILFLPANTARHLVGISVGIGSNR
jgi:hypothetical protein